MSRFTNTEILHEALWRKCADDPSFFFAEFWKIAHPEEGAIPFELFDAQKRALDVFREERYVITLKARQIGWTTLVAAYAFWHCYFTNDRNIIFLSKGEREAADILKKVRYGYLRLPKWMRARREAPTRDNQTILEFKHGSSIESLPSKSDPARGRSCYLVVVDEWASLENPDEAWASIEPITDVGGRVIGLSTAKGWGNFFHSTWLAAETHVGMFFPIFEPWNARDDRNADWYEAKQANLPVWQLHQEYPRNPNEAFLKSGNPYFDVDALQQMETVEPAVGKLYQGDFPTFMPHKDGELKVWEHPRFGDAYVIGADVAEGLLHGDFSSAHVIRWRSHEVVAHWHGHIAPDEFAEELAKLGRFYNDALIGVENNNHGLTTVKYLKDWQRYTNIFYMRTLDERNKRVTVKPGWSTTIKSRPLLLDGLGTELREGSLGLRDQRTITELMSFVRDETGKLRGSPFDDCVFSLGIAVQMLQYCTQHNEERGRVPYMSVKWWENTIPKEPKKGRAVLGANNVRG